MAAGIAAPCITAGPMPAHCLMKSAMCPFFFIGRRTAWQVELAFSKANCLISISAASP